MSARRPRWRARAGRAAEGPHLVGDGLEVGRLAGGDRHVGAGLGQPEGDRAADAAAAAGHQGHAAVQPEGGVGHGVI